MNHQNKIKPEKTFLFIEGKKGQNKRRPTCPICGNKEMNYFVSSENRWKCSKAHLHETKKVSVASIKHAV